MFTDVSIDLETLGTRPGSVITQIGLCAFNRHGLGSMAATQITVDPQSMIDRGFFVDWSTIAWWLKQDDAARSHLAGWHGHAIDHALFKAGDWFAEQVDIPNARMWGHGCGFDCTQLEIAYQRLGMPVPWNFRNVRDLRTLIDVAQDYDVPRPEPDLAHNAMSDAVAQAKWIQALTAAIESGIPEVPLQP